MPDIMFVDEGRFQGFLLRQLGEKQVRHVMSLIPPLRRQLLICLYNAFSGLNNPLLHSLSSYQNYDPSDPASVKHYEEGI